MNKIIFSILSVLFTTSACLAQGIIYQLNPPAPNAQVRICPSPDNGYPCPVMASIFADPNLTVPITQPVNLGSSGFFSFYIAAGTYVVQLSGPGYNASNRVTISLSSGSGTPTPGVFNSSFDPPLFQNYNLTTTGAQTGINLTAAPIDTHLITWRPSGTVTTCAIQLDTSPDNSTWTAGGAISSQNCTTPGQMQIQGTIANYVRVNLTTLTGGGSLTVIYTGRYAPLPFVTTAPPTVTAQTGLFLSQGFDTFTRANAATLGANWFIPQGGISPQIASNTAEPGAIGGLEYANFIAFPNQGWPIDACAQATIATHANNNTYGGPGVRMLDGVSSVTTGQGQAYFWGAFNGSGNGVLWRLTGGGATPLATGSALATGVPYTLCVQGQPSPIGSGVVLTGYKNGVLDASFTDSVVTAASGAPLAISGGMIGILLFATTAVTDIQLTNFSAGPIVNTPSIVNAGGVSVVSLTPGINTNIGSITAANQAIRFFVNQPTQRTGGLLQIAVSQGNSASNNQVLNPTWQLKVSQDGGQSWIPVVPSTLPQTESMGGDAYMLYSPQYNIQGFGGNSIFEFELVFGTVSGTLTVFATAG